MAMLSHGRWRRLIAAAALIALIWWLAAQLLPGDARSPADLAGSVRALGAWGPAVLMGLMVMAVLVGPVPTFPISATAGLAFGPVWGTVYAVAGATVGAMVAFGIARFGGRAVVAPLLRGHTAFCSSCSDRMLFAVVLLARLVPVVSFALVSYGAGLTAMSARAFGLATLLGMIPMTVAYVVLGASLTLAPWAYGAGALVIVALLLGGPFALERLMPERWARLKARMH